MMKIKFLLPKAITNVMKIILNSKENERFLAYLTDN